MIRPWEYLLIYCVYLCNDTIARYPVWIIHTLIAAVKWWLEWSMQISMGNNVSPVSIDKVQFTGMLSGALVWVVFLSERLVFSGSLQFVLWFCQMVTLHTPTTHTHMHTPTHTYSVLRVSTSNKLPNLAAGLSSSFSVPSLILPLCNNSVGPEFQWLGFTTSSPAALRLVQYRC